MYISLVSPKVMITSLKKIYDSIFITTFVDKEYINEYINSIIESNNKINVLLIIICQNGLDIDNYKSVFNTIIKLKTNDIISISEARNMGISYIINNRIISEYVMFPDDDSTYNETFFNNYFNIDKGYNYIIDVLCKDNKDLFILQNYKDNTILSSKDRKSACSVNMMIKFDLINRVGLFDINLGVGAKYGSAEDNDYYIRVCGFNKFHYTKQLYNFHPSPQQTYNKLTLRQLLNRFDKYGRGIIYCLCKHSKYNDAVIVCLRAIGGGIISLFKGEFKKTIAYFYSSLSRFTLLFSLLTNLNIKK